MLLLSVNVCFSWGSFFFSFFFFFKLFSFSFFSFEYHLYVMIIFYNNNIFDNYFPQ